MYMCMYVCAYVPLSELKSFVEQDKWYVCIGDVHVYVYIYTYIYAYIYIYTHIYICLYLCMRGDVCVCVCLCVCLCFEGVLLYVANVGILIALWSNVGSPHACMCARVFICVYACMYVFT